MNGGIIKGMSLQILPRYVKENYGYRPFQLKIIEAVKNGNDNLIIVDAPVGAGKSFVMRKLLEEKIFERSPIIFLYPTKILMEAQISSIKRELEDNIRIWPYEKFEPHKTNLFLYSTDSLVKYMKLNNLEKIGEKGELLYRLFIDIQWQSKSGAVVTSPDVLYLLVKGTYTNSKKILNCLQNALIIFDEFHCYYGLNTFSFLMEELLSKIANKIILLSATPIFSEELNELTKKYDSIFITFDTSIGNDKDVCFNYGLDTQIFSFKISDLDLCEKFLIEKLKELKFPAAIIFDSIFRLRHIEKRFKNNSIFNSIKIVEWSGMKKSENFDLDSKTLVLGTSSIEVGIDMNFKSLIFEATYWPSAIQRLGRVGRREKSEAVIFTRKDFTPFIEKNILERNEFENILKEVLNDPKEEMGDDFLFRGQSFKFLIYDEDLKESFIYNENVFAMYEIHDFIDDWQQKTEKEKKEILINEFGIEEEKARDIILYDKILPIWGLLKGKIKDNYEFLSCGDIIYPTKNRKELHIKGFVFYGV